MATRLHCPSCQQPFRQPTVFPFYCRCGLVILDLSAATNLPVKNLMPVGGPGTEMLGLTKELGVIEKPNCTCRAVAKKMDAWGVEGCSMPENHAWIVEQIRANAAKWTWAEKLEIAMRAATSELVLAINPLDVYGSLVNEAIRRAAASASTPDTIATANSFRLFPVILAFCL